MDNPAKREILEKNETHPIIPEFLLRATRIIPSLNSFPRPKGN